MTRQVPYTNHFGQVIDVGQKVAYVTSSHGARQSQGRYLGLSPSGGVTIEVMKNNVRWVPAENDYAGKTHKINGVPMRIDSSPYLAKTILQDNMVFPL